MIAQAALLTLAGLVLSALGALFAIEAIWLFGI